MFIELLPLHRGDHLGFGVVELLTTHKFLNNLRHLEVEGFLVREEWLQIFQQAIVVELGKNGLLDFLFGLEEELLVLEVGAKIFDYTLEV